MNSKGKVMDIDEKLEDRWLMYFPEFGTLYEENNATIYQQGLDEGIIDVTNNVFYENQYREEQKIEDST